MSCSSLDTQEETCFILYGASTRNGKSTFVETIIYLLGDYALGMKPESLAQKPNIDSRQASGDIARLCGARFVNANERFFITCIKPYKSRVSEILTKDKI